MTLKLNNLTVCQRRTRRALSSRLLKKTFWLEDRLEKIYEGSLVEITDEERKGTYGRTLLYNVF
jgi:hypothetical protein